MRNAGVAGQGMQGPLVQSGNLGSRGPDTGGVSPIHFSTQKLSVILPMQNVFGLFALR